MSDAHDTESESSIDTEQDSAGDAADAADRNGEWREPPDDFESKIDTSDSTVPDHPVVVEVEGRGEASATLVTEDEFQRYRDLYGKGQDADDEDADDEEIANDVVAAVLRENYESPDFSGLTGEDIQTSPVNYYSPFLDAIAPHMFAEGN